MTSAVSGISHQQVIDQLPAFIRGKLSSELQRQIQAHIVSCPTCARLHREELQLSTLLCETPEALEILLTSQQRESNRLHLMQRLQQVSLVSEGKRDRPADPGNQHSVMRTISIAASLVAVVLGGMLWVQNTPLRESDAATTYVTRSTVSPRHSAPAGDSYRVVFQPDATAASIRSLLTKLHAEVVNGPSATGVYTLTFSDRALSVTQRLEQLRRDPAILLAEENVHNNW